MVHNELYLEFNKVRLKIKTNHERYRDYLRLYFGGIIAKDSKEEFHVSVEARWQKDDIRRYISGLKKSGDLKTIGANTFSGENRILSVRKIAKKTKMVFDFREKLGKVYLDILTQRKPIKDFLRYSLSGKAREELFFEITYPVVYYPLFWYQETFLNTRMLHASAIEVNNRCIVICGLEGIGKTSMGLSLLDNGGSFISDNLISYDDKNIYPCYELIRLGKEDDVSLWKGKIEKINDFNTPKDFYRLLFDYTDRPLAPGIFIFPKFTQSFSVKKLDAKEAANKAIALSQLPAELSNYNEYRNLYSLVNVKSGIQRERHPSLESLLKDVPCFEIGMNKADGLARNSERLKEFIRNV